MTLNERKIVVEKTFDTEAEAVTAAAKMGKEWEVRRGNYPSTGYWIFRFDF